MSRKNKVETSEHFVEIHELLLQGKSPRWISQYLENEYGEIIGYTAIYRYKKNNIRLKERALEEVNKRKKREAAKKTTKESMEKKADDHEKIENDNDYVVNELADVAEGVLKVAKDFPEAYENMKAKAEDEKSPINEKDVANMSVKAVEALIKLSKSDDINLNIGGEINHTGSITNEYELSEADKDYIEKLLKSSTD